MTNVTYTHGHHDSVLRSHRWRTAENSAGYLLPHLRPGQSILDVGCGPGTITVDLAARVAPGRVVGIDVTETVIAEARTRATEMGATGVTFEVANIFALDFEDDAFDVVHAHQVLQHVADPVAALLEMRRVCRPGGIVAARDADCAAMTFFPPNPDLGRSIFASRAATKDVGGDADAGRKLLAWANRAGFESVVPSASVWCYATPEERSWWGGLWADRVTKSSLADQLRERGIATDEELDRFGAAWRQWAADPDGWFAVLHGEVLCRA